ncbi:MSP domain protein, partial [Trichinella nativa]
MNPTNHAVCFKIRSTRMEQLYMKPSFGVIQSNRAIYMRIKFRKLNTPKWDIKQDHLSIHFAVVPDGMVIEKPSDFWKNPDPSRKVLVHTININYGTSFEGMKGKKPEKIVETTKKTEMDEEEHAVGAAVVLEKMDTTKPGEARASVHAPEMLKQTEATALPEAPKISKLAEATALPENLDKIKKAAAMALIEASRILK